MIPILSFLVIVAGIWIFAWYRARNINKEHTDGYFFSGRSLGGLVIAGTMLMAIFRRSRSSDRAALPMLSAWRSWRGRSSPVSPS